LHYRSTEGNAFNWCGWKTVKLARGEEVVDEFKQLIIDDEKIKEIGNK
jgi:hypothetical protein